MEPYLLLKHRVVPGDGARPASVRATSIASILRPSPEDDDDGEGPYFDLEFSIPGHGFGDEKSASESGDDEVISESLRSDDPSDDLFFKGHSSLLFTPSSKPQLRSALLKSATKIRVFMLRFKKPPKSTQLEAPESSPKNQKQNNNKKLFVKFKVEEVPIVSLFTRDSSSSRSSNSSSARSAKLYAEEAMMQSSASSSDERKSPKDVIHKCLNKIKPLYVRVSKRYSDKIRFSGQLTASDPEKSLHSGGLRIVSKRLRKSRSASAAVAAVRSPPRRRDDSLVEQEDGIQSAIAHCKRSFNAGSDLGLTRSRSDPGAERESGGKDQNSERFDEEKQKLFPFLLSFSFDFSSHRKREMQSVCWWLWTGVSFCVGFCGSRALLIVAPNRMPALFSFIKGGFELSVEPAQRLWWWVSSAVVG